MFHVHCTKRVWCMTSPGSQVKCVINQQVDYRFLGTHCANAVWQHDVRVIGLGSFQDLIPTIVQDLQLSLGIAPLGDILSLMIRKDLCKHNSPAGHLRRVWSKTNDERDKPLIKFQPSHNHVTASSSSDFAIGSPSIKLPLSASIKVTYGQIR